MLRKSRIFGFFVACKASMTFRLCVHIVMGTSFLHISIEQLVFSTRWWDSNEVFIFKEHLTFLYKIDIESFKNSSKQKFPLLGIELTTPNIKALESRCLNHSAAQTGVEQKILELNLDNF